MAPAVAACIEPALVEVADFGANPGELRMFEHTPGMAASPAPLVVVLHGCAQRHPFAIDSGFVALADARGFIVVAPEQGAFNNGNLCFNWFDGADNQRDTGEALSIKQMIDASIARHEVDERRIFVAGVSAGAAMTSQLLAAYPDVFAGGAIIAGGPAQCAMSVVDSASCMSGAVEVDGEVWADKVRVLHPEREAGDWPRALIMHGEDDPVVNVRTGDAAFAQWAALHGFTAGDFDDYGTEEKLATSAGDVDVTSLARDGDGEPRVQDVRFAKLGHTLPIDPDGTSGGAGGGEGCGRAAAFLDDLDFCAARHIIEFFGIGP